MKLTRIPWYCSKIPHLPQFSGKLVECHVLEGGVILDQVWFATRDASNGEVVVSSSETTSQQQPMPIAAPKRQGSTWEVPHRVAPINNTSRHVCVNHVLQFGQTLEIGWHTMANHVAELGA